MPPFGLVRRAPPRPLYQRTYIENEHPGLCIWEHNGWRACSAGAGKSSSREEVPGSRGGNYTSVGPLRPRSVNSTCGESRGTAARNETVSVIPAHFGARMAVSIRSKGISSTPIKPPSKPNQKRQRTNESFPQAPVPKASKVATRDPPETAVPSKTTPQRMAIDPSVPLKRQRTVVLNDNGPAAPICPAEAFPQSSSVKKPTQANADTHPATFQPVRSLASITSMPLATSVPKPNKSVPKQNTSLQSKKKTCQPAEKLYIAPPSGPGWQSRVTMPLCEQRGLKKVQKERANKEQSLENFYESGLRGKKEQPLQPTIPQQSAPSTETQKAKALEMATELAYSHTAYITCPDHLQEEVPWRYHANPDCVGRGAITTGEVSNAVEKSLQPRALAGIKRVCSPENGYYEWKILFESEHAARHAFGKLVTIRGASVLLEPYSLHFVANIGQLVYGLDETKVVEAVRTSPDLLRTVIPDDPAGENRTPPAHRCPDFWLGITGKGNIKFDRALVVFRNPPLLTRFTSIVHGVVGHPDGYEVVFEEIDRKSLACECCNHTGHNARFCPSLKGYKHPQTLPQRPWRVPNGRKFCYLPWSDAEGNPRTLHRDSTPGWKH